MFLMVYFFIFLKAFSSDLIIIYPFVPRKQSLLEEPYICRR